MKPPGIGADEASSAAGAPTAVLATRPFHVLTMSAKRVMSATAFSASMRSSQLYFWRCRCPSRESTARVEPELARLAHAGGKHLQRLGEKVLEARLKHLVPYRVVMGPVGTPLLRGRKVGDRADIRGKETQRVSDAVVSNAVAGTRGDLGLVAGH